MTSTIEYVKYLNKKEVSQYIKNRNSFYSKLKQKVSIEIQKNEKYLIKEYEIFESSIVEKYKQDLEEFKKRYSLWVTKKCKCGKSLRYIKPQNFWGCTDYQNAENEHITFKDDEQQKQLFKVSALRTTYCRLL